jgi:hypothetical protein
MPRQICHEHCPRGSGGTGWAAVLVVLAIAAAAVARPVIYAAEVAVEIVLYTLAAAGSLVMLAGAVYAAVRVRRWRARRQAQAAALTARTVQAIPAVRRLAIEPRTAVIDGLTLHQPWEGHLEQ